MAKYDEKVKAECVEEVKKGTPLAEITKKLGPNPKAIERYCKKAGVEVPKKKRVAKKKDEAKKEAPKAEAAPKK